jgi:hypothetical protein
VRLAQGKQMLDTTGELNWLLDDLVGRVARVRRHLATAPRLAGGEPG